MKKNWITAHFWIEYFYKAKADDSDSDQSFEENEGQVDNLWQSNKKTASDVRKGMYQSQLKKVIETGKP